MRPRRGPLARSSIRFLLLAVLVDVVAGASHSFTGHARYRRQLVEEPAQQIDLNITVPYIFSARLYPYGAARGDIDIRGESEIYKLENPFHYMANVYDTIFIRRDGSIGMSAKPSKPSALPVDDPTIAVFWMPTRAGNVFYRETDDVSIVNLAHNEVNIQYRYGGQFRVKSVVLVTWENVKDAQTPESEGNTFQLALIIGDSMTFAHLVYSKLQANRNAVAGFSSGPLSYSLPDSATNEAILLSEKSDIGIPGEWLFRVDSEQIYLCGAGFKGLECIESCSPSQWFNDCSRSCHCDGGDSCDQETGRCPNGKCSPGWRNEPICDEDIDECVEESSRCPNEQPDCLNTAGAFLCLCFEYDEENKMCKDSKPSAPSKPIPVDVVPLRPTFSRSTAAPVKPPAVQRNRFMPTKTSTTSSSTSSTTPTIPAFMGARAPEHFVTNTPLITTEPTTRSTTTTTPSTTNAVCSLCDSHAHCENGVCKCVEGWRGDGFRCYDVDECVVEAAVCGNHSICTNTEGSFECSCEGGFRFEEGQCVDVDECRETPKICGDARGNECVNRDGAFLCRCRDGFQGDPSEACVDIDECRNQDACGPNATCSNTEGGFECECQPGFERLAEEAHCTDRDECAVEPCHPAAVCSNVRGSYSCACIEGYVGDGMVCHETILYPISNDSIVIPRSWDSIATLPLLAPITIFGRSFDTVYLSTNGVVSFDQPLSGLVENADSTHATAIFALHAQYDYVREGLVAYTFINETDAIAFPLLTRASLSVQQSFGLPRFRARSMHIFTFDGVRQAGSENYNSFQVVFAESAEATIASIIYELTQAKGPMTGISTPTTFFMLPNKQLSSRSNVGQPGKWMFRVDAAALQTCPPGRSGEPFCERECESGMFGVGCTSSCHCPSGSACDVATGSCPDGVCQAGWQGAACDEDIDECATGVVQCAEGSDCENTLGGYKCNCKRGFSKVGDVCRPVERCLTRFAVPCSRNADCLEIPEDGPKCECRHGFKGDGFRCIAMSRTAPSSKIGSFEDITRQLLDGTHPNAAKDGDVDAETGDRPFEMKNWVGVKTSTTSAVPPRFYTARMPPHLYTVLLWLLPTALFTTWIIVAAIVCVLCLYNRRKSREREYNRVWKSNKPRAMSLGAMPTSVAVSGNPNVIYGSRPRITYEGY